MAEETSDAVERKCPYCGDTYQPEPEDYSDEPLVEECEECGKRFYAYDNFSVEHIATPDCELNGDQHDYKNTIRGPAVLICTKCNKASVPRKPANVTKS